jgi:hypothetical protein
MKRWHEDFPHTYREWRKHYISHVESNISYTGNRVGKDPYEIDCVCDKQIGRFRKMDAWDCGNTQCFMCHSDKFPKREKTYQEWCADLKLKEGIKEINETFDTNSKEGKI